MAGPVVTARMVGALQDAIQQGESRVCKPVFSRLSLFGEDGHASGDKYDRFLQQSLLFVILPRSAAAGSTGRRNMHHE